MIKININLFLFMHLKPISNSIQNILINYSENTYTNKKYDSIKKEYVNKFSIKSLDKKFKIGKHTILNAYYRNWRKKYGSIEDFFKFGTTRNPWDRAISYYFFGEDINRLIKKRFMETKFLSPFGHYFNVKKYNDHKLDYVIRFEKLQQDFDFVCDKIGIPKQQLPHANKSKHKHYTEYYDDETRQIVEKNTQKILSISGTNSENKNENFTQT